MSMHEDLDPEELKNEGNSKWKNGELEEANVLWRQALKECIKYSMRGFPTTKNRDMQISLRLNLSLYHFKKGEFSECLNQCDIILENVLNLEEVLNYYTNKEDKKEEDKYIKKEVLLKIFTRKAYAYLNIQKFNECEEQIEMIKVLDSTNGEISILENKIKIEERDLKRKQKELYRKMIVTSANENEDSNHMGCETDNSKFSIKELWNNSTKDISNIEEKKMPYSFGISVLYILDLIYSMISRYDMYKKKKINPDELHFFEEEISIYPKEKDESVLLLKRLSDSVSINKYFENYFYAKDISLNEIELPELFLKERLKIYIINNSNAIDIHESNFTFMLKLLHIKSLLLFNITNNVFSNKIIENVLEGSKHDEEKKVVLYNFYGNYENFIKTFDIVNEENLYFSNICFIPSSFILTNIEHIDTIKLLLRKQKLCFILCNDIENNCTEVVPTLKILELLHAQVLFQPIPNYYSVKYCLKEKNIFNKIKKEQIITKYRYFIIFYGFINKEEIPVDNELIKNVLSDIPK